MTASGIDETADDGRRPVLVFADDDPVMLAALRGALRRERKRYDLHFVETGAAALAVLADRDADVVITDLHMPDMDGATLLAEVRDRHPAVVRYALSGAAAADTVARSVQLVHRWLSKPCDRDVLLEAIASALRYRRLLSDPELRAAVADIDSLPAAPRLFGTIQAMATSDQVSAEGVAEVAGSDPAIAAKILQLANSAFGAGDRVSDLRGAVVRIGIANVARLVLSHEVLGGLVDVGPVPGFDGDTIGATAVRVGDLAAQLASPADAMTARVAGLLHLSGLLVESIVGQDRLAASYRDAAEAGVSLVELERRRYGVGHPDLAGHLLSIWGVPGEIVIAAAGAYEPVSEAGLDAGAPGPFALADAVRVARLLATTGPASAAIGAPHRVHPTDERVDALLAALTGAITEGDRCPADDPVVARP